MSIKKLVSHAVDKDRFKNIANYIDFCARYLEFIETGLQARIVSQNENHYQFLQYPKDGHFNITRPLNTRLMYDAGTFSSGSAQFRSAFEELKEGERPSGEGREAITRAIYTIQQSIGAALDALPAGMSNRARKVNGDLFERLICLLVRALDVDCVAGTVRVPIKDSNGVELFKASYQHDLLISNTGELKIIGSVKTSSKDRIDKVFMDKFLYSRLTETALPHIAIFLNDVQRKKTRREDEYGVDSTFLSGHSKAYTMRLNALDGVYYCDIRPSMTTDVLLKEQIKTIDHFFCGDLWELLGKRGQSLQEVVIPTR